MKEIKLWASAGGQECVFLTFISSDSYLLGRVGTIVLKVGQLRALAGVAQWMGHRPANQKVAGLTPSQGTCLVVGQVPTRGCERCNRMMFLSLSLPLPSPLSKDK